MKKIMTMVLTAAAVLSLSVPAYAGQWMKNTTGWWYDYGNGSWPASSWQWIDGNNDGNAECYYFDRNGYLLTNTTTPDGYTVNGDGAWVKDGTVQTRSTAGTAQKKDETGSESKNESSSESKIETAQTKLLDLNPVDKRGFDTYNIARTNRNALWSNGFSLGYAYGDLYAEYYVGAAYSTLEFEFAPAEGAHSELESVIEVYGDDDELLWDSDAIGYKSAAQKVKVDISGQEYIRITRHDDKVASPILFKNAVLK